MPQHEPTYFIRDFKFVQGYRAKLFIFTERELWLACAAGFAAGILLCVSALLWYAV